MCPEKLCMPLEVLKARLVRAWSSLVECKVSLPVTGGVELDEL